MNESVIAVVLLKGNKSVLNKILVPKRNKNRQIPIALIPKVPNTKKWDIHAPNLPSQLSGAGILELKI